MTETTILVSVDAQELALSAAALFVARLKEAQDSRGEATIVITGGRIESQIYRVLASSPAQDAVDWGRVNVWWGDERFLPKGDPERNETQARADLLDRLPFAPARVHPIPGPGEAGVADPEDAADRYTQELAASTKPGSADLPHFDLVVLSIGENGHIASLFPEHPALYEARPVVGVRGSPKPPPNRVTLTLPALNTADEVWVLASGESKANAVTGALTTQVGPAQIPAVGARGLVRTLWLLDREAASGVPQSFRSLR